MNYLILRAGRLKREERDLALFRRISGLSGEATWSVECRVNLSQATRRRPKRHPEGNCLYKRPGIFIRMTVTHKDRSSLARVPRRVPSFLHTQMRHAPTTHLYTHDTVTNAHASVSARGERAREATACLNVYLAARNTLASHVRIEIMSSKESIVS